MEPNTYSLALVIEVEGGHVCDNIDSCHHHEHSQSSILDHPVIDYPSPDPGDDGFERGDRDHKLDGKLHRPRVSRQNSTRIQRTYFFVAIQSVAHGKRGAHLTSGRQHAKADNWARPVCFVVV